MCNNKNYTILCFIINSRGKMNFHKEDNLSDESLLPELVDILTKLLVVLSVMHMGAGI